MHTHLLTGTDKFEYFRRLKKTDLKIWRLIFFLLVTSANLHLIKAQAAGTLPYTDDLESQVQRDGWIAVNGSQTNKWYKGTHGNPVSSNELYVSNGTDNNYSGTASTVHIYREIAIPSTVAQVSINYAYRVKGNATSFFNVWLVPSTFTPIAGTKITPDPTRILITDKQTSNGAWQDAPGLAKTANVSTFAGTTMRLVFEWINGTAVNNTATAIDKIDVKSLCANPPAAIQGSASTVCVGSNTPAFTNATKEGAWSVVNGTGTASINSSGILTGTSAGNVIVLYTTNSCSPASYSVTVNSTPAATTVSGGGTFCGTGVLTATGGSGGTIYFQGINSGGTSKTMGGSTQTITTSGTYYFRSQSASGCWGPEGSATVTINPSLGSSIAVNPIPSNSATGICYSGTGAITSVSWGAVKGATSYDVYFGAGILPTGVTATVTTNSYSTGSLSADTTFYWKIVPKNSCGNTSGSPIIWNFRTLPVPCACTPVISTPAALYINSFQFVGTLNDNLVPNISGANGYADYTVLTPIVKQTQGAVLNIVASALGTDSKPKSGYWKAWVDYSADGTFSNAEQVYSLTSFSTESLTFGFVIPPTTPVGKYRLRIRVGDTTTFGPCTNSSTGETEDYVFEVTADCSAKVNTTTLKDVSRCGTGTVTLTAASMESGTGTGIRWYAAAHGGSPLFDGADFVTPVIMENTNVIYYVVAYNGTCGESVFRIPVTAIANPGPVVKFSSIASFCESTTNGQVISATNGKRLDVLLYEQFDSNLGSFVQSVPVIVSGSLDEPKTYWINRPSPYIPVAKPVGDYEGLAPAISSGYTGGNFMMSNTDYNRAGKLLNSIETANLDTRAFDNLNLEFDLYYFTIVSATDPANYFSVDYSINGSTWINLQTIYNSQGNPNIWEKMSIALPPSVLNLTTLKIRFSSFSFGKTGSFKESIAAIDNVKISGIKDESSEFSWTSPVGGILYESTCNTLLNATKASTVCVKPSLTQFESTEKFSITASANFSNGCPAIGTVEIANDLKIWDTTTSTDWNVATNWKPSAIPTANKCVIIKKPVVLGAGADGFAKNITIDPGGTLTIKKDQTLTVTDYIKNKSTPLESNETNLVLETDGNLIQLNSSTANSGRMTAQRTVSGLRYNPGSAVDYVYWSSPVGGQKTKNTTGNTDGFSSGTANTNFFTYRESNDRFYETGDPTFTLAKGYAVQAERNKGSLPFSRLFEFKGTPNNGDIGFPLAFTNAAHGYNLVGNPYPSNINFEQLHYGNSSLIWGTAWFWTNNVYTANQMGSGYTGNNYAIWNGSGGVGATSPYEGGKVPNGIVKVGQAFIVQAKSAGTLNFKNKYDDAHVLRVKTTGDFYSKNSTPKNRFLIQLLSPSQLSNSQLIAYVEGATDGFEQDYDAEAFGSYSDLFYSIIPGKKLVIQGKSEAFNNEDKVILGANFFQNGTYTIALENAEGIFNGSQNIYLKDKQQGIITNLSQGSYTFLATKADNTTRFEIIYKPETVLVTDSKVKEGVVVYRDSDDFVVKAQHKKITSIEVFDVAGRLIYSLTPNSLQTFIPGAKLLNSIYVLKINQGGIITTKKIIK